MPAFSKVAIVTGATGFIGKHLIRRLVADGWDLHVIVRPSSELSVIKTYTDNRATIHCYTGAKNDLSNFMKNVDPCLCVVFHLASLFLSQHQYKDIIPLMQSNIVFGTQLVEVMVENRLCNLINTGTSWQHYKNAPYNPVCLYAATKEAFSSILKYYEEVRGLRVITLKLFDTYGNDDVRPKLFNLLEKAAREGKALAMSPGEQYIDLVHVEDIVDAYIMAAEYLLTGKNDYLGEYALSSNKPKKLKDLVELYEKVTKKSLNIIWGGRPYREREIMEPWNKGRKLPEWSPKVDLDEGIKRMIGITSWK